MSNSINSKTLLYTSSVLLCIIAGLLIRSEYVNLPWFLETYLPDTLWGMMIYWMLGVLFLQMGVWRKWVVSLLFCFSVEFSQLLQYEWLVYLRSIKLFALVLGYGFKISDLICYVVGFSMALLIDKVWMRI